MSRIIKFRVWNPWYDKMEYEPQISLISTASINDYFDSEQKIMQYVGLKGKTGVEIYEGDVLKCKDWNPETYQVCFFEGGFCLASIKGESYMADINMIQDSTGIHFEVIGNIYEHPHLLE